eukprot:scaffold1562_cov323-Prasinococcus_capsulatus_cf.AAC.6
MAEVARIRLIVVSLLAALKAPLARARTQAVAALVWRTGRPQWACSVRKALDARCRCPGALSTSSSAHTCCRPPA